MRLLVWAALLGAGILSFAMDRGLLGHTVPPDLDLLPAELGPLHRTRVIPVAPTSLGEFPPERFHFAAVEDEAGHTGKLYVAWFARGRRWSGRPHATEVCFAASGWEEREAHRLPRAGGGGRWSRLFRRDGREIRVVHWLERPGASGGDGWWSRLAWRLAGRGGAGLRQDVASIYWEFPADASPNEADLNAASDALATALHALWGE